MSFESSLLRVPSLESDDDERRLGRCLSHHVVDVAPHWNGSEAHRRAVGRAFVGFVDGMIDRCTPPLDIPHLALNEGKSVVVVGPNGAGKSTLFDAIMERGNAHCMGGSYGYTAGVHGKEALRIARLDQEELLGDISDMSVMDALERMIEHYKNDFPIDWENPDAYDENMANQEAHVRLDMLIGQAIDLFEIDYFIDRNVGDLSGGERTKLSLLMLLASEPDVLLLDEPTNHLDLESIAKLTGLFDSYKRAGVCVVSSSHVEWFLDMVGMDGTIELVADAQSRTATMSSSPHHKFKKRDERPSIIDGAVAWNREYEPKFKTSTLFHTNGSVTIPDSPLHGIVPPTVHGSDLVMFSGKNGTGKTKLMEEMADRSSALITKEKGLQIAYLPQIWPDDVAQGTVEDFFEWVRATINPHSATTISRVKKELRRVNFRNGATDIDNQPLASLSGGEQRLLWFLSASVFEGTDVLILDEPSNHMDHATMLVVCNAIRSFPGAVVLSSHDVRLMRELESFPGNERVGTGVHNIIFERRGDRSGICASDVSPSAWAQEVIAAARKRARRVKV